MKAEIDMLDNGERIKLIAPVLEVFKRPIKQENACQDGGDGKDMGAHEEEEAGLVAMKAGAPSPRPLGVND